MTTPALNFTETALIGKVASVDTSRVLINVENSVLLTRISIGCLLAIKGTTQHEFLIGLAERVTRTIKEDLLTQDDFSRIRCK
jgi:hypothetical protein